MGDSQILRWIDELNGITDADARAEDVKRNIRLLRRQENSVANRREIRRLYNELDRLLFKPDYLCVIMDKVKDYRRACKGFVVNGVRYVRLLGTNGGIKNSTIVFVSEALAPELRRRIENERDPDKELVPAKLEAYKALVCSASAPVSSPRGILVVSDCETEFTADTIYLDNSDGEEPTMSYSPNTLVSIDASDGYGLMLPSLAERWSEELKLGYTMPGANTRNAWEKGMVLSFDFLDFAEKIAGGYMVKDAWGTDVDIRDVELVLTTSMVKLWDSYGSCSDYLSACERNHYTFNITKVCPEELESERTTNYQFIQPLPLNDEDIEELIAPTISEIKDVLFGDVNKAVLFLKGMGLNEDNITSLDDDYVKAMMLCPEIFRDPYVKSDIFKNIKKRITDAKVGVLKVHGNYSMVSGDPYSLCQHIFDLPVTGILKSGEIYNKYWCDRDAETLVCFRAPMTSINNILPVHPNRTEEAAYWYQHMTSCTILSSWDTAMPALNGLDFDGDMVMLTDNPVLVRKVEPSPAVMCVQRKAAKKVPTEEDLILTNINSFGNDIGAITNRITSMFEVREVFDKDSPEYKELDYRIKCGQLYQQDEIDKAKGIIATPMPREWYDRHAVNKIRDEEVRRFALSIVADKKPYFMRYIYPDLMKQYKRYIGNTNKMAVREFKTSVAQMLSMPYGELSDAQADFLRYYRARMPVGTNPCVMNKICRRFEEEFDGCVKRYNSSSKYDYEIMKSGAGYTVSQYRDVSRLYKDYCSRVKSFHLFAKSEQLDSDEIAAGLDRLRDELYRSCLAKCSSEAALTDIFLDICYVKSYSRGFVWHICGEQIVRNIINNYGGDISFPEKDPEGDIVFGGERFSLKTYTLEVDNGNSIE